MNVRQVRADVTRALRTKVLRANNRGYSTAPGDAEGAVHLAAFDGDEVVGAVVLLPEPCPLWPERPAMRLRGMAVEPGRQGSGIGSLVLDAALPFVAPVGLAWCNARTTARPFYERHGFVAEGDEFVTADTGIPHFLMWRNVSPAPPRPTV